MTTDAVELEACLWPAARAAEALHTLALRARLDWHGGAETAVPSLHVGADRTSLGEWVEWAAARAGLEAEPVESTVPGVVDLLRNAAPALLALPRPGGTDLLLLVGVRGGRVSLIGPDGRTRHCPVDALRAALCRPLEAPLAREIDPLLERAGVAPQRRAEARRAMQRTRLAAERIEVGWLLRGSASEPMRSQFVRQRFPAQLLMLAAVLLATVGLEIAGWRLIGAGVLDGRLDFGWLLAWALLMLSTVPLHTLAAGIESHLTLRASTLFKQRLLNGTLALDAAEVRQRGAGQWLGTVMEAQALESLLLNGGLSGLAALVELLVAAWVLSAGAGGIAHVAVLVVWLAVAVVLGVRQLRRQRVWTRQRLAMTHDLVERMVGHRTTLAQEPAARRDGRDDQRLMDYLGASQAMDHGGAWQAALVPGGWMLLGLLALVPAYVAGQATPGALAVGLGGVLLAQRALGGLSGAMAALGSAAIAWREAAVLFAAPGQSTPGQHAAVMPPRAPQGEPASAVGDAAPVIEASGLVFRHSPRGEPVLRGVDLVLRRGERVLLEGASGTGKSTLAALLSGLNTPDAGLLLLRGLDRASWGERWQRWATEAPQFHENHIFGGSLAFNLLMGREWPPSPADMQLAADVCRELELSDLLQRMPAGLQQQVGETGWQLSHGERSRVFLARALLQRADLTILDESFAALDPQTLERCLRCVFERTSTLMVIAHP